MNRLCLALLLTVATATVASNGEPEVPAILGEAEQGNCELDDDGCLLETIPDSRAGLNLGAPSVNSRLLASISHKANAAAFLIHDQDITFRGPEFTNRVGTTQNARPSIRAGGLWHEFVTIRIQGARGRGFDYNILIDGAINCSNS